MKNVNLFNGDEINQRTILGHPSGLFTLFFTEMWERFSYYGMRAILVLFLISSIDNEGWGWDRAEALELYALYTGLVYVTPIFGGLMQPSAGTARHDAVAWGYARQADSMGVDIIQNCEVTGFDVVGGKINGVRTSRGDIKVKKIGLCVAGSTNILAEKLNMTVPVETHLLQACVSEPVKPVLDRVVTFGAGHFYISQSDKGEMVMGGDLDGYNSYAQRGNLPTLQHVLTEGIAMMPFLSKLKMLRTWGGIMDMSMDGSPIIDKTHIEGLYLNCGWCYGGFKATPASGWTFAHTIAQDRVHKLNSGYSLNRFNTGHLLDEKGLGTKTWIS